MAIDFHADLNRTTYASREASDDWAHAITRIVDPIGRRIVDVGCGGGIYALQWARLGAATVTGVDFSAQMISAAREKNKDARNVSFLQGGASATGLADQSADIVFERALIHHLDDLVACLREARRLLVAGGRCIVQDRTPQDVALPGSLQHLRGYFFEKFPRLLDVELGRRRRSEDVVEAMTRAGFNDPHERVLWETRRTYDNFEKLAQDLRARTGRSILHELSDAELDDLIAFIGQRTPSEGPIVERDRWTIWDAA